MLVAKQVRQTASKMLPRCVTSRPRRPDSCGQQQPLRRWNHRRWRLEVRRVLPAEEVDQISADLVDARVLPPLGVAVSGWRGEVRRGDEDDRVPARLVDVAVEVSLAEPGQGLGEDRRSDVVASSAQVFPAPRWPARTPAPGPGAVAPSRSASSVSWPGPKRAGNACPYSRRAGQARVSRATRGMTSGGSWAMTAGAMIDPWRYPVSNTGPAGTVSPRVRALPATRLDSAVRRHRRGRP